MLVALSGRKGSGKSLFAEQLLNRGFTRISFADTLKKLVSTIYNWELSSLYCPIQKEEILVDPVLWNKETALRLSELTNIKIDLLYKEDKTLFTRREVLNYIGTEILRKYNDKFHIEKFIENYDESGNYVCDDMRFPNELLAIKSLPNTYPIFVCRPCNFVYSNHESEISLRRHDFEHIFLNYSSKKTFIRKINFFIDTILMKGNPVVNKDEFVKLLEDNNFNTEQAAKQLKCSRDKIVWWATKWNIPITRVKYKCDHNAFAIPTPEGAYWAGVLSADGCVKCSGWSKTKMMVELSADDFELVDGFNKFCKSNKPICKRKRFNGKTHYSISIISPYIVDDMKYWCIEPRKSKYNKIPDCIKGNDELLCYWLVGLIDGSGCICYQDNSIKISILCSKQISDYLLDWLKECNPHARSEKNIDNLFDVCFHDKHAVNLYKKIYRGIGLKRRWEKVKLLKIQ
jgi:hypothetical protein